MLNLIIIGPSGSGKGTQAKILAEKFGISHLSTGKLFRQAYKQKTPEGIRAAEDYWLKGEWVPTDMTMKLLGPVLDKAQDGFILDGFPRLPEQPSVLAEYLEKANRKVDRAIILQLSDEEAIKRLLLRAKKDKVASGKARLDETKEAIKQRLRSYYKNIQPIIEYYQKKGILEEVDGSPTVEVIAEDILSRLKKAGLVDENSG